MFYSKSTGGFYTTEINGESIPSDAVEITEAEHKALLSGQGAEKVIAADENGKPYLADPPPPTPGQLRARAKAARSEAVERITVTVGTKVFDGDETSQTRMARAIIGMQAANVPTMKWVLADNSITDATLAEFTEAMVKAGQAQSAVWFLPG